MGVQKSVLRHGRTLAHGTFKVRETVHVCKNGCLFPSGVPITRRADELSGLLMPHSSLGYDVMVFIGKERFLHFQQREEIRAKLMDRYGLEVSTGDISRLAGVFLEYIERLHESKAGVLRAALKHDGGWPMHIDATGEGGRGTLFVVYSSWRNWVMGAWKIPTENADAILPHLIEIAERMGEPCAVMRDLGVAVTKAANSFVETRNLKIPIFSCHLHFLKDVGSDLLEPTHDQLRSLFRHLNIRPKLRAMVRDLGHRIGAEMEQSRNELLAWQTNTENNHVIPSGRTGLAVLRASLQWVLDYAAAGSDNGFPFDRPYFDLHCRCIQALRVIETFLDNQSEGEVITKLLGQAHAALKPVMTNVAMTEAAKTQKRRAALFDELRTALRFPENPAAQKDSVNGLADACDTHQIHQDVDAFAESLRKRCTERRPACDQREAIDTILKHLDKHGDNLWGHKLTVQTEHGQTTCYIARTNNCEESFFHRLKHGERRRSGRKNLTKDFEDLPAAAALAQNLHCQDYVELVCGTIDNLPQAFAELDAQARHKIAAAPLQQQGNINAILPTLSESASLSREDRNLVRTPAMNLKMQTAGSRPTPARKNQ